MNAQTPSVVVYVNGANGQSFAKSNLGDAANSSEHKSGQSGQMSAPADPYQAHRDFPLRWQRYLLDVYRTPHAVIAAFGVTERTARKWLSGESGANGGYVAIAMYHDPQVAGQYLFAAE